MTMHPRAHPTYRITANGSDLSLALSRQLQSITVTDAAGFESDTLELVLADDPNTPIALPATGAEIRVFLGYADDLQDMGLFVLDEVEPGGWPAYLALRGRAAPYEASKGGKTDLQTQKTRDWPKGTLLSAMVAKIAKEHGLEPAVAQSLQGIALPHFDQTHESDISFLVRVTRQLDAVAKPGGGKLIVAKRGESKTPSGKTLPPAVILAAECSSWCANMSARDGAGTVVAYYHDHRAAKRQHVQVGSGAPVRELRANFPDADSAKRAAQSELDRRARGKNRLTLKCAGNPTLTAEGRLALVGFRSGMPTDWVVSRVVHRYDTRTGYSCEIEAEAPTSA